MARAKRTERAEARRRHRAATAADPAADTIDGVASPTTSPRSTSSTASKTSAGDKTPVPGGRMGFMDAFRASIRPIHVRQDLASLPWIAIHTKALWIPLLITIASTVAVIGTQGGSISQFMFAYFIQTPAIGGVFIAGFLAPRASWLLGVVVGLVAAVCYGILVIGFPTTDLPGPAADGRPGSRHRGLGARPVAGHRWLLRRRRRVVPPLPCLLEPQPWPSQNQKPTGGRPGDGRTRGSTSQKAGAKR